MGEQPMVSVIVPVYNSEKYLDKCIESVVNQSFDDWELILVDDGSTDTSGDICYRWAEDDRRIIVVEQCNRGVSFARNAGIDKAKGKYLFFLDSDDAIAPQCLDILVKSALDNHADIALCMMAHCSLEYFETKLKQNNISTLKPFSAEEAVNCILYQDSPFGLNSNSNAKLFDRKLFDQKTRFCPGRYEDLDISYRLFIKAKAVILVPQFLYLYRKHSSSFIYTWSAARLDVLDVVDRMINFYETNAREFLPAARDRKFSANYNILLLMYKNGVCIPDVEQRCWNNIKSLRYKSLINPRVRLKNKLGAIASYGGRGLLKLLAKSIFFRGC